MQIHIRKESYSVHLPKDNVYHFRYVKERTHSIYFKQGQLHGHATCAEQGPVLRNSTITILKYLEIFEQRPLHFHFSLGLSNYIADPDFNTLLAMKLYNSY